MTQANYFETPKRQNQTTRVSGALLTWRLCPLKRGGYVSRFVDIRDNRIVELFQDGGLMCIYIYIESFVCDATFESYFMAQAPITHGENCRLAGLRNDDWWQWTIERFAGNDQCWRVDIPVIPVIMHKKDWDFP